MQCSIDMPISERNATKDGGACGVRYSAEELERLLANCALERIGMGTRRTCYRLPDGRHCLKCYRSDAEIAEGKHPGQIPLKPLAAAVVREIRRCRFNDRRNTSCHEYRYWLELKKRLPADVMAVFPASMEKVLLPSRGWALVEELVVNADGSLPRSFAEEWRWGADAQERKDMLGLFNVLCNVLVRYAVRFFDPQNILVQRLSGTCFRLRITDFEPASRLLLPVDRIPQLVRFKIRRRFARHLRVWSITPQGGEP